MEIRSRRGMTLAEIMVSLALVSVMIVMAVSFVMLVTKRTRANTAADAVRGDLLKIEAGVEGWLNAVAEQDVTEQDTLLKSGEYELSFSYGVLTGTLPEGKSVNLPAESVKTVRFKIMKNRTDYLVFCYVECENGESGEAVSHVFCVNPRIGEAGGA